MLRSDFWSGLVVALFGFLALVWLIPNYAGSNPFAQMPPGLLPSIAAWVMLICGVGVALSALSRLLRAGESPLRMSVDWSSVAWAAWPFLFVFVFVWLSGYVKLTWLGAPMIGLMLFFLGERRWKMLVGYSVVPVVLVYLLSAKLMQIGVI